MNCTNATTEIPPLKAKCNRHGLHVPGDNPTPSQIIPIIEQRLAAHQNHLAKNMNPWTGDYVEWKAKHDDLTEFLSELQQTKNSTEKSAQNSPTPSHPTNSNLDATQTEPGLNQDDPGLTQTEPGFAQTKPGPTQTEPGQTQTQSEPTKQPTPPHNDEQPIDSDDQQSQSSHLKSQIPQDPPPPKLNTNDEELLEAADDLPLRLKGRSRFDQLTAEQQAAIIDMMDIYKPEAVLKLIAEPSPTGFSFKTSRAALYAFRSRYKQRQAAREKQEATDRAVSLMTKSPNPTQAFLNIYESLLHVKALTAAGDPDCRLADLEQLTATITKLRKQTLAERKQRHAESK